MAQRFRVRGDWMLVERKAWERMIDERRRMIAALERVREQQDRKVRRFEEAPTERIDFRG